MALARYPAPLAEATSRVMRGNYRRDTRPEVAVRSLLSQGGLRFRKDFLLRYADTHTRPDIVFTKQRLAVFIDGCFWHGCPRHGTKPAHNAWYWLPKIRGNRQRDRRAVSALNRMGWRVLRFWEHEDPGVVSQTIHAYLTAPP